MSTRDVPLAPEADEPACGWFEATVQLMDGELSGGARAEALAHVAACLICGPLVRGWSPVAEHLEARLDDAVERAKPALFELPGHALESIAEAPPKPSLWLRLKRQVPAFATFSTAVAMLFVLVPRYPAGIRSAPSQAAPAVVAVAPRPPAAPALPSASSNDCHMHSLAFDGADGMVYRTETDGMTVIWVHEHEGA